MRFVILLSCPDRPGIVARVTRFIEQRNGNIVESIQHSAIDAGVFFMRIEWDDVGDSENKDTFARRKREIETAFADATADFDMKSEVWVAEERPRIAIMVSHYLHCLYDLLLQWREAGERAGYDISCVISNHADAQSVCSWVDVPFYHIAVQKDHKAEAEQEQLRILTSYEVDTVVLARYMQILSADFITHYPFQVINIHHSFLPAFVGARPYHQAYARGVKIIGATSHYVTAELDQGPIIEQDVKRINHRDTIADITNIGRNLERTVLSRALNLHLQRRVYIYGNKTIVFG